MQNSAVDVSNVATHWHWNDTSRKKPPTVYYCNPGDGDGMRENKKAMKSVLPEYQFEDMSKIGRGKPIMPGGFDDSNEYDVFIGVSRLACSTPVFQWLITHFNGHIVLFSGESDEKDPILRGGHRTQLHAFGPVRQPRKEDMTLYYMQLVWWYLFQDALPPLAMTDPSQRPRGNGTHYMMYAQANCVGFRDEAVGRLSEFGAVHCGGKCGGRSPNGDNSNLTKVRTNVNIRNWWDNMKLYSDYRFCVVLEHAVDHSAYITEKIMMAFIGGCIPIYYGPPGIFDIFNEKAFVFYNISDPQPALDKVKALESNKELYEQMRKEPIAAHGNATIEKYFSFSDEVGNGALKQRTREKLGLRNFEP